MAKKTSQPPTPPPDDFDPDREINEEIVPIDEADADDLFAEVAADAGDDATKTVHGPKDHALPDVEVEGDEVVAEVEADDLFADVVAEDDENATKTMHGAKNLELPAVEVDADEALVAQDEEVSPHEAKTMGEVSALGGDDPFAGVTEGDEGELVGAGVVAGEPEEPVYEEEVPKPSLHWFTWTLIGLNLVAALVAPYLLLLDFQKRQQYAHAVFMIELRALGLPNEEEETSLTAARVTLPAFRISADEIKSTIKGRNPSINDKIEGFDEQILRRVPPSTLTPEILKDHFRAEPPVGDLGEPVATVEAEVRRLQSAVVADIEKAAQESNAAVKSDADKRSKIEAMLHPLAMDAYQAKKLDKRIKEAAGPELQKLYIEAAERRMAFDFLLPLELFRPGDGKGLVVEKFGDLDKLPLDKVKERVTERIKSTIDKNYQPAVHLGEEWGKMERDTIEKRLTISFTLLSLAHVKKPDGVDLYPQLLERIPRVMGQYDFALACELFPSRVLGINEKVLERIKIDRDGFETDINDKVIGRFNEDLAKDVKNDPNGLKSRIRPIDPKAYETLTKPKGDGSVRSKAFVDNYQEELQRIRFLQNEIVQAKLRLKDLQDQKARDEAFLKDRQQHREDLLAGIAAARAKTEKDAAELRLFQDELFRYQLELATSEEKLNQVHRKIREKFGATGGKQP